MYADLTPDQQLLLAIEFHLGGAPIPQELVDILGHQLISEITHPDI